MFIPHKNYTVIPRSYGTGGTGRRACKFNSHKSGYTTLLINTVHINRVLVKTLGLKETYVIKIVVFHAY